jgi:triacylglycerol lipase
MLRGSMRHRLYFSPGMFGFGRLASYDYFTHLERSLSERLRAAGDEVETHVAQVSPTASIRRRAAKLAELVASTCDVHADGGPIHLIGHSTGGLDARLVAALSARLDVSAETLAWRHRLASITTINTPHLGTPLASFFATASGERVLRTLSALTFIALSLGAPPLSVVSMLVVAFGRFDRAIGFDLTLLDRATDGLLRALDGARSREVREYIDAIKRDQGAMVQLMPEAMDLFAAAIEPMPGIVCQSTASMAPPPGARMFAKSLLRPWSALSGIIFTTLHRITSRADNNYPCASPDLPVEARRLLVREFGTVPGVHANDGVVPLHSQLWGNLVWAGYADHLDVLGHFRDSARSDARSPTAVPHVDWLYSGSTFDRARFASLSSAIAEGLLEGARPLRKAA